MTPSNQLSLGDLTNQMKHLAQSAAESGGEKDFQLSETAHQNTIALIQEYRTALMQAYHKAANHAVYGNVGGFASAQHTRSILINDIYGPNGALTTFKKFIDYLDEFENAVNASHKKSQAQDHGSSPIVDTGISHVRPG